MAEINHEYEHKQKLIEKAKLEYIKRTTPSKSKTSGGSSVLPCPPNAREVENS